MCLIVFAWKAHPDYRLVVAANRDEYHARPTQRAHWWSDQRSILAGRDLQAGGTWLGLTRNGRFAAITNYRERQQKKDAARSRGDLVSDFLGLTAAASEYSTSVSGENYAGFSLLLFDGQDLSYSSNRGDPPQVLPPGVYGLSNAALDTPWPKLHRSKEALQNVLDKNRVNTTELLRLLQDRTPAAIDAVEAEGLPFSFARSLTAPFIVNDEYGTRCSTAVIIDNDGQIEFAERSFSNTGKASDNVRFQFVTT